MLIPRTEAWRKSRLRRVLLKHSLVKLLDEVEGAQVHTQFYMKW